MKGSPSRYGGIAAVLVLGLGLMIVGFNLASEKHEQAVTMRWAGAVVLIFGLLVMAIILSQTPGRKALIAAIGAMIFSGFFAYYAASNEISDTASYHRDFLAKGDRVEAVTRDAAPVKFRKATNYLWAGSGFCLGIAIISFTFHCKLEE